MTRARVRRVAWWALVIALTAATLAAASLGGQQMRFKSRQMPARRRPNRRLPGGDSGRKHRHSGCVELFARHP
jgi:hypothetical protein